MLSVRPIRAAFASLFFFYLLWSYVFFFLVRRFFYSKENRLRALERLHERHAGKVFRLFTTMKGVYLKIGQFLSTQIALLPPAYLLALSQMQDRIPKVSIDVISKRIRQEYGKAPEEVFDRLDQEPLASASIGQVHRVLLKDGREAVIKVKYPDVERFFISDIKLIRLMSPYFVAILHFAFYRERAQFDIRPVVAEFGKYIELELDYRNEVKNHRIMYDMLKEVHGVVVPELYPEFCTDAIICMEYIAGARVADWYVESTPDQKKDIFYQRLADGFLHTITRYGTFQADPHPGNFLIREVDEELGPETVFLDFGCVKQFPDTFKQGTIDMMQAYFNRDTAHATRVLADLGFATKQDTLESLEVWVKYGFEVIDIALEHFKHGTKVMDYLKDNLQDATEQFMEVHAEHRIDKIPEEYLMIGRVLATPPIPLNIYQPMIDFKAMLLPHLNAMLQKGPYQREQVAGAEREQAAG